MRKLILLSILLASCSSPEAVELKMEVEEATALVPIDSVALSSTDSVMSRMNTLINSTENAGHKVGEIKVLKKENVQLKQELVATKSQLEEVKAIIADTSIEAKKKKRNFLQKIVDTIKKDTIK